MDPVSIFPAIVMLFLAVSMSALLVVSSGAMPSQGKFASIDGLRGYLAFFVFLHHSCIWYFYLRGDQWEVPPSNLYTHFGQSSVILFFMITGFLFFTKLLNAKKKSIDWLHLYCSRFLRLVPLYLFAMLLLLIIIAYVSHGNLNGSPWFLLKNVARWLDFTILGSPDINGIRQTQIITAGVTWSLPYEWFFYSLLPLLAMFIGIRPSLPIVIFSFFCFVFIALWQPQIYPSVSFLGGIAAAILVRSPAFCEFSRKKIATVLCLACLFFAVYLFPIAYEPVPIFLLSGAFILIACGNSLFGILLNPISRKLGEMAYSIYLLHGILLFVTFRFVLGFATSKSLSPFTHWLVIGGLTPILIIACFFTFQLIENPSMKNTNRLAAWLRKPITFFH